MHALLQDSGAQENWQALISQNHCHPNHRTLAVSTAAEPWWLHVMCHDHGRFSGKCRAVILDSIGLQPAPSLLPATHIVPGTTGLA